MFVNRHKGALLLCVFMAGTLVFFAIHAWTRTSSAVILSSDSAITGIDGPRVDHPAPDFALPDVQGQSWTLSQHRGHPAILAFFCGCDRCHHAACEIASLQRQHKLPAVVCVVAEVPGAARQFARDTGLQGAVLSDQDDSLVNRYDSAFCPRLWGVSSAGLVTYRSPIALEGADLTVALHALQIVPKRGADTFAQPL